MAVSGIIFQMITLFIMMFAGYLAARAGLISPSFRRGLSSLVLSTAFPCCIVSSVLQSGGAPGDMVVALGVSVAFFALMIALAAVLVCIVPTPKPERSLDQLMLVFTNLAFMGIPIIQAFYGAQGVAMLSMFLLVFNFLVFTYGVMLVSGNGNLMAASVLFEAYMKAAGINVEINQYENATYNSIRTTDSATEWDIMLINEQPASSATNLWGVMYFADENLYDFGNLQHFSDPKYQELYDTMAAKDTHSTESVQAFLDYTEENCYMYGLFVAYRCTFGSTNVLELAVDSTGNILCGGCKVKPE